MQVEQLWREVEFPLRRFVRQKVKEEDIVDDLMQDIFLKIRRALPQLRDIGKVESWMFRIAHNVVIDYFRNRPQVTPLAREVSPEAREATAPPEREDLTHRLAQWLPHAIELLPEKYRQAVYLTEIEGLNQKELAERLGLSYSGAKSRVQRGREKLKAIILDCCDVMSDRYGNILDYQRRDCCRGEE